MTLVEIAIILLILALGWFWHSTMGARETGLRAVRALCDAEGVQLLDETIAIARLRPRRDRAGRMNWLRVYQFEYSETGENRRSGSIHLVGHDVVFLTLGPRPVRGAGPPLAPTFSAPTGPDTGGPPAALPATKIGQTHDGSGQRDCRPPS